MDLLNFGFVCIRTIKPKHSAPLSNRNAVKFQASM
ncbi:hypothetical protein PMAG_a6001 [Pseudoalteromonas mariniglutinosa NCIMB 1770]|nr:hypothetical protein [Pseudoalteromonas mariniglutinosa NCIMB 1770]